MKEGMKVLIVGKDHPHRHETGVIEKRATGGPAAVGLDWEVRLTSGHYGAEGCFAASDELQELR